MQWRPSRRLHVQALKSGLLTQLATAPSPPNASDSSDAAANEAAAGAVIRSAAADVICLANRDPEAAGGVNSAGVGQDCGAVPSGLSVQGHQISLQRQPPRTPARVSPPAGPLPLSSLGPLRRGQAAEHSDVCPADKAAAGLGAILGTAPATSIAQPAAPPLAAGSTRTPMTKQRQPAASRLSIAERAMAALDSCTTDADRRVGTASRHWCRLHTYNFERTLDPIFQHAWVSS